MVLSRLSASILILFSMSAFGARPSELNSNLANNQCRIEGDLDPKTKILISVEMAPEVKISQTEQAQIDQDPDWLHERYFVLRPIKRVQFRINSVPVMVPQSAFEGLFAVGRMRVWKQSHALYLFVQGGDGGESYRATFKILPSRRQRGSFQIAERVLRHGEFPSEVWAKTIYHNTIWDDPKM